MSVLLVTLNERILSMWLYQRVSNRSLPPPKKAELEAK